MTVDMYKIGQKITLKRKTDDIEYSSVIQNIQDDKIYITVPYKGEQALVLMHNESVTVKYISKEAAYHFESVFLGLHMENEVLRLYKIAAPDLAAVKRVQLRQFVRVPVMLDVEYCLSSSDEKKKGISLDLSAGGMRLAAKEALPVNTVLELNFQISVRGKTAEMQLKGEVMRCYPADDDSNVHHVGIKFLNLDRSTEDMICSYVFQKQMEQLRKR